MGLRHAIAHNVLECRLILRMINIIAGLPGAGKTAYLSKLVQKFLKEGETIYSYKLLKFKNPAVKYFNEIFEIKKIRQAIIILDEAQIWFNSRTWERLDPGLQYALQQHRHMGVDIYGAVQHVNRLDAIMRELVQEYWEINRIAGTNIHRRSGKLVYPRVPWQLSTIRHCDIKRANNVTHAVGSGMPSLVLFTKKDFEFYDTLADYSEVKGHEKYSEEVVRMFRCNSCGHLHRNKEK